MNWDADGICRDDAGHTFFLRCIRFMDEHGAQRMGGIHLSKSTERVYYVQLFLTVGLGSDRVGNTVVVSTMYEPVNEFMWVESGPDVVVYIPHYPEN